MLQFLPKRQSRRPGDLTAPRNAASIRAAASSCIADETCFLKIERGLDPRTPGAFLRDLGVNPSRE
jgi:hypothetical protein